MDRSSSERECMASEAFEEYVSAMNKAYTRRVAMGHTHRPGLKRMIKQKVIKSIMELNKSARREFLAKFSVEDLELYLEHLIEISPPDNAA